MPSLPATFSRPCWQQFGLHQTSFNLNLRHGCPVRCTPSFPSALRSYLCSKVLLLVTKIFHSATKVFHSVTKVFPLVTKVFSSATKVFPSVTKVFPLLTKVLPLVTKVSL